MENELFSVIPGHNGNYIVTSLGRVITTWHKPTHDLRLIVINRGYCVARLFSESKKKSYTVHRLVANAFLPNPNNLPCVNHKDGNKTNNTIQNLEWCTHSYNTRHAFRIGLMGEKFKKPRTKFKNITAIDMKTGERINFIGIVNASKKLGISASGISSCLKGRLKVSGGYKWEYSKKLQILRKEKK